MHFDGTGDYLSVPYNSDFDFGTGDFTIDTWFYHEGAHNSTYRGLLGNSDYGYVLFVNPDNKLQLYANACGTWIPHVTVLNITPINQWVHVAVVREGSTIKLYEGGVLQETKTDV